MANKKSNNSRINVDNIGKIPPQAIDLEQAVLGALMLDGEALSNSIEILRTESFYLNEHQKVFSAIEDLFNNAQPVDILTVTNQLRKNGELKKIGGPSFVSSLTERVASAANIEAHARIIAQKYIQRELIKISSKIITDSYDETSDVFDLLSEAEQSLYEVSEGNIRRNYDKMSSLIRNALEQIEEVKNKESEVMQV